MCIRDRTRRGPGSRRAPRRSRRRSRWPTSGGASGGSSLGARRKARELALQMLFEHDIAGTAPAEMFLRSEDFQTASSGTRSFTERLVAGTIEHRDALDALISRQADHWRLMRMPIVDRNILRMALFELLHEPE